MATPCSRAVHVHSNGHVAPPLGGTDVPIQVTLRYSSVSICPRTRNLNTYIYTVFTRRTHAFMRMSSATTQDSQVVTNNTKRA